MKLVWSADTASKAYIDTVKSCQNFKESGLAELLSAMAAGWNSKLIVESWSYGGPIATSVGLAIAAHHTCGRHVCIVPDEWSRSGYVKAMHAAGIASTVVIVGEAEEVMEGLAGVDFLVVDSKRKDFARVIRFAKLNHKGAVLACKNACHKGFSGFRWHEVLQRGTRVVRSVLLPVGQGVDIAHIGAQGGGVGSKKSPSRWIKYTDQQSGEEHVFRD
ncbi:PREDICTED: uncharacterized protein LOC18614312 [Theobroma cacao]|uniref:Uncharacterized protein LOC18614312 n=2 Tax=Theobroma cacao TaxID=3641 RepID=A0AB32VSG8_THECC|nr:PREDICTED: uncharacterized protein LOC18614312 [Theobroma cacao]EOX96227.1 Uncharacterized protein TCM_005522 [Theobroma cacao]